MKLVKQAIKNKEIKNRIVFTLMMLIVFGVGSNIPIPGINHEILAQIFSGDEYGLFDLFNLFTGGSFQNFTLFAVGISPYITASIIVQLLTISFPYFEELSKEGATGKKKMSAITRYLAIVLALIQATGISLGLFRKTLISTDTMSVLMIILLLTAGTGFLIWLGEQISEFGIGNGMSMIIFAGIIARMPVEVNDIIVKTKDGTLSYIADALIVLGAILIIIAVVIFQDGVRKVPLQYGQRTTKGRVYGKESSFLPIKVNTAGVVPIIFALAVLQLPITMTYFAPNSEFTSWIVKYMSPSGNPGIWIYMGLSIILIIAFTYFYTSIIFKPDEIAKNLMQSNGHIPGIRPGKETKEYLKGISNRLCLLSAIFLSIVSILPTLIGTFTPLNLTFGGTSVLIMVGVAIEAVSQIENRLLMEQKHGFLRSTTPCLKAGSCIKNNASH